MANTPWELPEGFDESVKEAIKSIFKAFANAKKSIPKAAIDALKLGNIDDFLNLIDWSKVDAGFTPMRDLLADTARNAGFKVFEKAELGTKLTFDIIDERAVYFAQTQSASLVTMISEDIRANIRDIIASSTAGEMTWLQASDSIYRFIPLTNRDANAVMKYEERQYERFLKKGMKSSTARKRAAKMAEAYAEKLTLARASTIARTEIANAAMEGSYLGWEAGVEEGLIDGQAMKEWVAEPDACELCGDQDGKTVKWDEAFEHGKLMPPQHPNCRCSTALKPAMFVESPFIRKSVSKAFGNQFEIEMAKHLSGRHDQASHAGGRSSETISQFATRPKTAKAKDIVQSFRMWDAEAYGMNNKKFMEAKIDTLRTPSFTMDTEYGEMTRVNHQFGLENEILRNGITNPIQAELDKNGKPILLDGHSRLAVVYANNPDAEIPIEWIDDVAKHLSGKHDQSSHAGGRVGSTQSASYPVPNDEDISGGLISATYPYVGLSSKAQAIAAQISPSRNNQTVETVGRQERTVTQTSQADYLAPDGNTYTLEYRFSQRYDLSGKKLKTFGDVTVSTQPSGQAPKENWVSPSLSFKSSYEGNLFIKTLIAGDAQSVGIATALLELARRETPEPIWHSSELTRQGAEFANTTKSVEKADSFKPTSGMVTAAERALRWKKAGKATGAGTPVGWGRATDIVSGRSMSLDVVQRMYSFFSRHEVDKKGKDFDNLSNPSNGRIMWDAWGGDAGFGWSRNIVERHKRMEKHLTGQHDQMTHAGGHSTARPYELKNRALVSGYGGYQTHDLSDPKYMAVQYATPAGSDSGAMQIKHEFANGLASEYEVALSIAGYQFARQQGNLRPDKEELAKLISSDPKYPKMSQALQDYSDSYRFGTESYDPKLHAQLEDYLKKENTFVLAKLRDTQLPDGKKVGDIMDDIASTSLEQLKQMVIANDISLTMPLARFKKMVTDGRYKTAYEAPITGKGASRESYLDSRMNHETSWGVPENTSDSERPVYGVFNIEGMNYGDTRIYLKDEAKHRTTLSIGDSIDGNAKTLLWASDVSEGKVSTKEFWQSSSYRIAGYASNEYASTWFEYDKKTDGPSGYKGLKSVLDLAVYNYVESQIHGGVKMSDISRVVLPPSFKIPAATQKIFDDNQITVEREDIERENVG